MDMKLEDVSGELRYRADRLRSEMDLPRDPSSPDGKLLPVSMLLAVAMLDAVREEWASQENCWAAQRGGEEVIATAKELASKVHSNIGLITSGNAGQSPYMATCPQGPLLVVEMNLIGMKPLWVHYLQQARKISGDP